jgi:hypothetical protein
LVDKKTYIYTGYKKSQGSITSFIKNNTIMKETIELKKPAAGSITGKIITLANAAELTNSFTNNIEGKTHVSFDAVALRIFIEQCKCELISFRYCLADNTIALIALPVQASETEDYNAMCSASSQRISYTETLQLTDNLTYNFCGVHKHIFSAGLVVQILDFCNQSINIFFGKNNNMPALVFVPENMINHNPDDEICLDYGSLCPPDCP